MFKTFNKLQLCFILADPEILFFSKAKDLALPECVCGGVVYEKNSAVSWPAIIIDGMIFSPDFSATRPFELIVLTILAFLLILS